MTIRGGKVQSIAGLKASLKKGGGGSSQYLTRIPADGSLTVRFLTEPDDGWIEYYEHYDQTRKFYPCSDDCSGCAEGDRPSSRYLANALDVAEGRVVPLVLPKSVATSLEKKYSKYATLLDRDYEISRTGTGLDTEYDVTPEPPTKMNLTRFDPIDLWELLETQLELATGASASSADDDDDDEIVDDEVDDDEDVADANPRSHYMSLPLAELKKVAKKKVGDDVDLNGRDKDAVIDLIVGDSSDDEESGEVTEAELRQMSLAQLKTLARELNVRVKTGAAREEIIDLILDTAAEDVAEVPF